MFHMAGWEKAQSCNLPVSSGRFAARGTAGGEGPNADQAADLLRGNQTRSREPKLASRKPQGRPLLRARRPARRARAPPLTRSLRAPLAAAAVPRVDGAHPRAGHHLVPPHQVQRVEQPHPQAAGAGAGGAGEARLAGQPGGWGSGFRGAGLRPAGSRPAVPTCRLSLCSQATRLSRAHSTPCQKRRGATPKPPGATLPPPPPPAHPNTASAAAVASSAPAPAAGAAARKAAISAVRAQPAAVTRVSSCTLLSTPSTRVPSVTWDGAGRGVVEGGGVGRVWGSDLRV